MLITDRSLLEKYRTEHRVWQGVPAIAHTKGGKTYVAFYSGMTKETFGNYVIVLRDNGDFKFSEPIIAVENEGKSRAFDPVLWIDPFGRLWLIWSVWPDEAVYGAICENPDEEELKFGETFYIGRGIMMNKPIVSLDGSWFFPIYIPPLEMFLEMRTQLTLSDVSMAYAYKSSDNGKSFIKLGGVVARERSYDENMIVELDSGVLAMYVRTTVGVGVAYSYDRGAHFSKCSSSEFAGPDSRFHISKLKSGRILLINHYEFSGRTNLYAMLSEDGGKTFPYKLQIDERYVSYPDAHEAEDGFIYIAYDRERGGFSSSLNAVYQHAREVLVAKITEEDILAGKIVNPDSRLKVIASKLGKLAEGDPDPYRDEALSNTELAKALIVKEKKSEIVAAVFEKYPMNCITANSEDSSVVDALAKKFLEAEEKDISLLERFITAVRERPGNRGQIYPIVNAAKTYIDEHLSENMTVAEICENLGVSVYYMCHLFKSVTGATMTEYRNERRIYKAKQMLFEGEASIGDIAASLGFSSASYFSELFLKSENVSPTEYRKLHKN